MIHVKTEGPVCYVTLNRPEVRNAFNDELIAELIGTFQGFDPAIRAVVLAGENRADTAHRDGFSIEVYFATKNLHGRNNSGAVERDQAEIVAKGWIDQIVAFKEFTVVVPQRKQVENLVALGSPRRSKFHLTESDR